MKDHDGYFTYLGKPPHLPFTPINSVCSHFSSFYISIPWAKKEREIKKKTEIRVEVGFLKPKIREKENGRIICCFSIQGISLKALFEALGKLLKIQR